MFLFFCNVGGDYFRKPIHDGSRQVQDEREDDHWQLQVSAKDVIM